MCGIYRENLPDPDDGFVVMNCIKGGVAPRDVETVERLAVDRKLFSVTTSGAGSWIWLVKCGEVLADDALGFLVGSSEKLPWLLTEQNGE